MPVVGNVKDKRTYQELHSNPMGHMLVVANVKDKRTYQEIHSALRCRAGFLQCQLCFSQAEPCVRARFASTSDATAALESCACLPWFSNARLQRRGAFLSTWRPRSATGQKRDSWTSDGLSRGSIGDDAGTVSSVSGSPRPSRMSVEWSVSSSGTPQAWTPNSCHSGTSTRLSPPSSSVRKGKPGMELGNAATRLHASSNPSRGCTSGLQSWGQAKGDQHRNADLAPERELKGRSHFVSSYSPCSATDNSAVTAADSTSEYIEAQVSPSVSFASDSATSQTPRGTMSVKVTACAETEFIARVTRGSVTESFLAQVVPSNSGRASPVSSHLQIGKSLGGRFDREDEGGTAGSVSARARRTPRSSSTGRLERHGAPAVSRACSQELGPIWCDVLWRGDKHDQRLGHGSMSASSLHGYLEAGESTSEAVPATWTAVFHTSR